MDISHEKLFCYNTLNEFEILFLEMFTTTIEFSRSNYEFSLQIAMDLAV